MVMLKGGCKSNVVQTDESTNDKAFIGLSCR